MLDVPSYLNDLPSKLVGTTPQVYDPTKPRRFCHLPTPGTDRPFIINPNPRRGWGECWRRPIASIEDVSRRGLGFTDQGCEGAGAEATCVGSGAVDAGSAGLAGSTEMGRSPMGTLTPSFRRGSIALRRDRVSREPCSGKPNNTVQHRFRKRPFESRIGSQR